MLTTIAALLIIFLLAIALLFCAVWRPTKQQPEDDAIYRTAPHE